MADHIAAAQRYRARAAKCELSAKNTSSEKFGECYRLLARQYLVLANMEEDCAQSVSPFARRQEHGLLNKERAKKEEAAIKHEAIVAAEQMPVRSVAARMFAVRQLQMASPSTETVSMPPMVATPAAEFGR
jgi:hypothetical protein